jgi:UDP-N-acetylmuramoyl-tripeptide--D-alanyl-D-alanine ligase
MIRTFSLGEVARATGASGVPGAAGIAPSDAREARGATLDSRRVREGQVFVPLPGTRTDGHAFVADALGRGALASFTARAHAGDVEAAVRTAGLDPAGRLLVVESPEAALGAWANARREAWGGELVGLCGSNGKTTTKEMLASILSRRAPTGRTEGNLNNQLGVPVTLTRLAGVERYAVVEIGMNHPGEVRALAALARPTAAVITNVSAEHLEGLGTIDEVARAEAEVGEGLPPGAPLVVPGDDPRLLGCVRGFAARKITFSLAPGADYVAEAIENRGASGMSFRVSGFPPLSIPVPGRHSVRNALAALACAHTLGMTPDECAQGLAAMTQPPGRMEVASWGGVTVLLDHYNANPGSVEAALETLTAWPGGGKRFAALGDMLELGSGAPAFHAEIGRRAAALDGAFLWGALMEHAERAAHEAGASARVRRFADRRALGQALAAALAPGDVVLVKGSRGSVMEDVLEVLKRVLDPATPAGKER